MVDLSNMVSYVAALSVATERITEALKRLPKLADWLSVPKKEITKENGRVIAVHVVATGIAMGLCLGTKGVAVSGSGEGMSFGACLFYALLASGGSSFWNSALDTLREVKKAKQSLSAPK
jgi:hypothetical protein